VADNPKLFLFLDFDGVLHLDSDRFDRPFKLIDHFCAAVRDADHRHEVAIVIASSWRLTHSLDEMVARFPMDIALRIVGVTPDLATADGRMAGLRQREVEAWMADNAPGKQWLAVDDRADNFDPGCPGLFAIPWADPQLALDQRSTGQPLSPEQQRDLRVRRWRNHSLGLDSEVAAQLTARLHAMLDSRTEDEMA
jgi:HAD domain in Swiss Army Knife RNA repair proteins